MLLYSFKCVVFPPFSASILLKTVWVSSLGGTSSSRDMKGIDLFCKTPASTAICKSTDQKSMVRNGTRAVHHQVPHLSEGHRTKASSPSSQPPSKPNSHCHHKCRKSSSSQTDLTRPPGSSRYLLNDSAFMDTFSSDFNQVPAFHLMDKKSTLSMKEEGSPVLKPSSATSYKQVVVLKVSLHCKGCEGKVRKHISRMEGVTSFSIDFSNKKVTVIGYVTPLGVFASVSKVKNAQFWPSPSSTL